MKKKTAVMICVGTVLLLLAIYAVYASFNGSIAKKAVTTYRARDYIDANYPGQGYEVAFAVYDFKTGSYRCRVVSPTSADSSFSVFQTDDGLRDDYDWAVTNRENTISRLSMQLDDAVERLLLPVYPHRTRLMMCDFCMKDEPDRSGFELDMELDLAAPPHPLELTVWVETSGAEPEWDEAAELLRELVTLTEKLGMDISCFSISVEYPYDEAEGELKPTDYSSLVGAFEVPKETITGDGLEAFLSAERERRELEQKQIEDAKASGEMYK